MPYVTSDGVDLYYQVYGSGNRTVMLAHGMGGNSAIWFNQVAALVADYQVVVFDHRYFARSTCPVENFLPAKFPNDALAIMDALDIDSATFICQSMGGWTGSQLAVHHPDRIDGLIMSHTPGVFTHPQVSPPKNLERLTRGIGGGFHTPALAEDFPDKDLPAAVLYQMVSEFNGIDNSVIAKQIAAAGIGVDIGTLKTYDIPTLFITGNQDVLFASEYIEALAAKLPHATCVNLGDVGHSSYFERPEAFNAAVQQFLDHLND